VEHEQRPSTSFATIAHRWSIVLLVAVPLTLGAVLFVGTRAKEYQSSAVVSFTPRTTQVVPGDVLRLLLPRYPTVLKSDATLRAVARRVGISKDDLASGLEATIPVDAAVMTVRVRLPHAADTSRAANALADEAVRLARSDSVLSAQVAVRASPATQTSALRNLLIVLAAAVVGVVFGALSALLVERISPRVRNAVEAEELTGLPVLGLVPRTRALRRRGMFPWPKPGPDRPVRMGAHRMLDRLSSPAEHRAGAEIATIWMGLRRDVATRDETASCTVILVTSAARGAGVSTVATLLAHDLARLGVPVLLLDANLEQPSAAIACAVDDHPGLIEFVEGTAPLEDTLHASLTPELTVLPTRRSQTAVDRVVREFPALVDKLRGAYRAIVVDAPPLRHSDLARMLCSDADRCLLVVRAQERSADVREAAAILGLVGSRHPGVVLNCVGRRFRHAG
jgi:Mrp family chromosome partitioning ATPase